jgi:c-di-AMP phosphodiesterase-like protein
MEKKEIQKKDKNINKKWISKSNLIFLIISLIILYISFKHRKIGIFIILFIITIIILLKIVIYKLKKKDKEKGIKAGFEEPWHQLYGDKITNISYPKNNIIINSFKENGENYNKIIGNVNNGKDYLKNEKCL